MQVSVDRRSVYRRRRWAAFLVLLAILIGLLFLSRALPEAGPADTTKVERMQSPVVQPQLSLPVSEVSVKELDNQLARIGRSHTGTYEAAVYDPESGKDFGVNADRTFMAASLAKLPVLITLYKAAARHELSLNEKISILPSDVQNYGTGVLYGYPVGSTMTLRECASYLIKESDNTAWVMLERRLSQQKIEAELSGLGAIDTNYETIMTTPHDVVLMLRAIADPGYTTPDLSREMLSLMTDTAFEDRLPEPLPKGTRVAHKIGSYEDTFSDAGVVFHENPEKEEKSYFIVAVGRNATEDEARSAIREMSLTTYKTLVGSSAN